MRKLLLSIITLVLFVPMLVKAEIDCGKYVNSLSSSNAEADVVVDGTTVKLRVPITNISTWSKVDGSSSTCPSTIYCVCNGSTCDSDTCYLAERYDANYTWTSKNVYEQEPPAMESTIYKEITTCRAVDYEYIQKCGCMPAALATLTSRLYMLIKIAAPALLLIIGGFDLIKAMSAQDDKAINKARQKLVRKFIAAAAVFLVFTVVQFLVATLATDTDDTMKCFDYMLNDSYNP